MKKIVFVLIMIIFNTQFTFSQMYNYKKVYIDGQLMKIKGSVSISDTLIIINTNGTISNLNVKKEMDIQGSKTYKLIVQEKSDIEMRLRFSPSDKDDEQIFICDTKDNFNQKTSSITYFLKKVDE